MKERTYRQYCTVAHALDVVGDRWTLLIVRDLLSGARRFTDLQRGLPGIGTNILTDRLKGLEESQIVRQRVLPPPAASTVYELTPAGRKLRGVVAALAQWGARSMGALQPDEFVSPSAVALAAQGWFRAVFGATGDQQGAAPTLMYAVRCTDLPEDMRLVAQIDAGRVSVTQAPFDPQAQAYEDPSIRPLVTLTADVETLFRLTDGQLDVPAAIADGRLHLDGDANEQARWLAAIESAVMRASR